MGSALYCTVLHCTALHCTRKDNKSDIVSTNTYVLQNILMTMFYPAAVTLPQRTVGTVTPSEMIMQLCHNTTLPTAT